MTAADSVCQLGKILDQAGQQQHPRARWNCDDPQLRHQQVFGVRGFFYKGYSSQRQVLTSLLVSFAQAS